MDDMRAGRRRPASGRLESPALQHRHERAPLEQGVGALVEQVARLGRWWGPTTGRTGIEHESASAALGRLDRGHQAGHPAPIDHDVEPSLLIVASFDP